jgi:hypothetical protein
MHQPASSNRPRPSPARYPAMHNRLIRPSVPPTPMRRVYGQLALDSSRSAPRRSREGTGHRSHVCAIPPLPASPGSPSAAARHRHNIDRHQCTSTPPAPHGLDRALGDTVNRETAPSPPNRVNSTSPRPHRLPDQNRAGERRTGRSDASKVRPSCAESAHGSGALQRSDRWMVDVVRGWVCLERGGAVGRSETGGTVVPCAGGA